MRFPGTFAYLPAGPGKQADGGSARHRTTPISVHWDSLHCLLPQFSSIGPLQFSSTDRHGQSDSIDSTGRGPYTKARLVAHSAEICVRSSGAPASPTNAARRWPTQLNCASSNFCTGCAQSSRRDSGGLVVRDANWRRRGATRHVD